MDARKFWTQCRLHDWFYMMSDDPEAYRDGEESERRLLTLAKESPAHAVIYEAWRAYHHDNGPRPVEPKLEEVK
jgi:hypothetical protein